MEENDPQSFLPSLTLIFIPEGQSLLEGATELPTIALLAFLRLQCSEGDIPGQSPPGL